MEIFHFFALLCLSCGFAASNEEFPEQEVDIFPTLEKAHYHFDELQKSFAQITSFQKRSSRVKRDLLMARGLQKYDVLYNLLLDFCYSFQNSTTSTSVGEMPPYDEEPSEYTLLTTPVSQQQSDDSEKEPWVPPDIHPFRISAVSEGHVVHVLFHVDHTVPVEVTRLAAFDMDSTFLEKSEVSDRVMESLARFSFDTSTYCEKGYETDNVFSFESQRSKSKVELVIDMCKFVGSVNSSDPYHNELLVTEVNRRVNLPHFQINLETAPDSDSDSGITVHAGQNETIDLIVQMDDGTDMSISGVFHDRRFKKMFRDEYRLVLDEDDVAVVDRISTESHQFFTVQVLNNTVDVNGTSETKEATENENEHEHKSIPIRLTLITESGHVSGKLYLKAVSLQETTKNNRSTAIQVSLTKVIKVKKPNYPKAFPGRRVYMDKQSIFLCTKGGNVNHDKIGRNCTMSCGATGRSIDSISIAKDGESDVPIYRKLTHKTHDTISLMVDVGVASPATIDGGYVCSVTTSKGTTQTQKLFLYSRPPKIDASQMTVDDIGNGTYAVTCAARGQTPMNLSVEVGLPSKQIRIDNETTSQRRETENENGVVLTVEVSSDILSYPAQSVVCVVSSDLGKDNYTILLFIDPTPNEALKPQIFTNESRVLLFDNGTTMITCAASHVTLLEVTVSSGNDATSVSLDSLPGLVRIEEADEDTDKQTVTWSFDIDNLIRTSSWRYCVAVNQRGTDYFKLPSQVVTTSDA